MGGKDLANAEKRKQRVAADKKDWVFYIHQDDSLILRILKKTGNFFYVIFMAIIGFIVWLIAALPG